MIERDLGTGHPALRSRSLDFLPFSVEIVRGGVDLSLTVSTSFAVPAPAGVTAVELVVQRDVATGECVASALSAVHDRTSYPGLDDPSRLDDAPCGPFR